MKKEIKRKVNKDGSITYREYTPFKYQLNILFKKYWITFFIFFMITVAFIPQILNWIYPKQGISITVTDFTQEQLLSFYGSYIAFFGTTVLGIIVVVQNYQNRKDEDARNRPVIQYIKSKFYYDISFTPSGKFVGLSLTDNPLVLEDISEIKLTFQNTSNQYTQVHFHKITLITHHGGDVIKEIMGAYNTYTPISLKPYENMAFSIVISNDSITNFDGSFVNLYFYLTNSLGDKYIEKIELIIDRYNNNDNEYEISNNGILSIQKLNRVEYGVE